MYLYIFDDLINAQLLHFFFFIICLYVNNSSEKKNYLQIEMMALIIKKDITIKIIYHLF